METPVNETDEKIGVQDIMLDIDEDDRWKPNMHSEAKPRTERR